MFEDRKIKKVIKKRTKPEIPFEEFCKQRNIRLDNSVTQGSTKVKVNVFGLGIGIMAVCVCIFAIIAISIFLPKNKPFPLPEIKYYGADMVKENKISYEEFTVTDISTLIDFGKVEQYGAIMLFTPIDGEDLVLGYTFNNILYGFWKGGELYAFEITLTIRCYEGYLFAGNEFFEDFQYTYKESCKFSIAVNNEEAYIFVASDEYEYFITTKEYEGITPINKENIELLIQDIL